MMVWKYAIIFIVIPLSLQTALAAERPVEKEHQPPKTVSPTPQPTVELTPTPILVPQSTPTPTPVMQEPELPTPTPTTVPHVEDNTTIPVIPTPTDTPTPTPEPLILGTSDDDTPPPPPAVRDITNTTIHFLRPPLALFFPQLSQNAYEANKPLSLPESVSVTILALCFLYLGMHLLRPRLLYRITGRLQIFGVGGKPWVPHLSQ